MDFDQKIIDDFNNAAFQGDVLTVKNINNSFKDMIKNCHINDAMKLTIKNNHLSVVQYFILAGFYPYFGCHQFTSGNYYLLSNNCFMVAARYNRVEIMNYLLSSSPIEINKLDCVLQKAVEYGHLEIVKIFVNLGSNINRYDGPLFKAAKKGHFFIVKYLISMGAEPCRFSGYVLKEAVEGNHMAIVKYLISVVGCKVFENGDTLEAAVKNGNLRMLKYLLAYLQPIKNIYCLNELLNLAVKEGDIQIVKYLIFYGCDPFDLNAISIAQEKNHKEIVMYLNSLDPKKYNSWWIRFRNFVKNFD